jgi:lipoyl(octanoyl) transferase
MQEIIINNKISELFGGSFELIDDGFNTGEYNMKYDFERVALCSETKALPMFRLYGWKPWTVSLGANQNEFEINKVLCDKSGFGLVRRPTGGRAVLHANELTYSVVLNLHNSLTVQDIYREIHVILVNSFKSLGIENLDFAKSQPDFRDLYKKGTMSQSCFASTARYEIEFLGRKVVGSAQRLFGNTLLQHGSILIGSGHEQLADVIEAKDVETSIKLKQYIKSHAATLSESAGRELNYEEVKNAVKDYLKL